MSGQRKNYSEYEKQLNEYVRTHPRYAPLDVDLRVLSRYISD